MKEFWQRMWRERPFAIVGATIGVLWAFLAVKLGFFAALFILIAGLVGWFVGVRADVENSDWGGILERIFPRERD